MALHFLRRRVSGHSEEHIGVEDTKSDITLREEIYAFRQVCLFK